jgi:paraquat-inducible protein A
MNDLIACHGCDLLVDVSDLADGEKASCPRCSHFLTRYRSDGFSRVLAYSLAGLIFLAVANGYPFLSFSAQGLESVMTLPQTPGALVEYGRPELAVLVAAFIIFIPAVILLSLLAVVIPLLSGRPAPWLHSCARFIFSVQSWSMVEVFIIGVIVSLVKIMSMATVVLGASFWAYAAFSLCFTLAVASLDRYQCWRAIDEVYGNS